MKARKKLNLKKESLISEMKARKQQEIEKRVLHKRNERPKQAGNEKRVLHKRDDGLLSRKWTIQFEILKRKSLPHCVWSGVQNDQSKNLTAHFEHPCLNYEINSSSFLRFFFSNSNGDRFPKVECFLLTL